MQQSISLQEVASKFQQMSSLDQELRKKDLADDDRKRFRFHYEDTEEKLDKIFELLPSGSGIDSGVQFVPEKSTPQKLVFKFGFHHMDVHGGYDGWTYHLLTITPEFGSFKMVISGRDKNKVKEYLYCIFVNTFII